MRALENATATYDLFNTPAALQSAQTELKQRQGPTFKYETMPGNRAPALDYRKK
jgi:aminobenzoyl-glutamate utilization protein B